MRLDRFLVQSNICSRSDAKRIVRAGRVSVNDRTVSDPSVHIDENADRVMFDNSPVVYEQFRYYMLNKPQGYVTATCDGKCGTVLDLLEGINRSGLFPVGRLDKDTEGLLLITDNGKLAHDLLSPKRHVDKCYLAVVDRKLTSDEIKAFAAGVDIGDDKPTLPAVIEEGEDHYLVTIREGRFHQIKRMFAAFGAKVTFLKRLSMGPLTLDEDLESGQFRKLTDDEVKNLF